MTSKQQTDIRTDGWVNTMPEVLIPYLKLGRFDRPVGVWLTLLPAYWSMTLAAGGFHLTHAPLYILFLFGAILIRSAGCVINDLWDRELDKSVARTAVRPLASGALSVGQALIFLAGLLTAALLILLQLPIKAILVGCFAIVPIILYPLMKRITYWPQLFLGVTFNLSVLIGWFAIRPDFSATPLLLYSAAVLWTIGFDTIYAHQDMEDDLKIGIKSTAIRFGAHSKRYVCLFYTAMLALLMLAFLPLWYLILPGAVYISWLLSRWQPEDFQSCLSTFKANAVFGLILWLSLIIGFALFTP